MKLMAENGTEIPNPDSQTIEKTVQQIDAVDNTYVILMSHEEAYIQAAFEEPGLYALEYRENADHDFYSEILVTQEQVIHALQRYAKGDRSWKEDFRWMPLGH
ncbi:MAG: hypothetical protein MUF87_10440 [Anaerolineae bacterium]|jgi:hypothetical protein|nr:hypothetical protein [Anaerolineae bacterium]